jgi:arsenite methyltransferase
LWGCGNGISACKLAKTYGSRIVGIDISEGMVELSRNWAQKEGLTEIVGFRVADAQELPFEDDVFDAVISVTSFPEDKVKAISEYVRVVKSGGFSITDTAYTQAGSLCDLIFFEWQKMY